MVNYSNNGYIEGHINIINITAMKEQWKAIKGYNGMYEVSNAGRIRSWKRPPVGRLDEPKLLKLEKSNRGYLRTHLSKHQKKKHFGVHRLVAKYFIPNPEGKETVNHIDGDKTNNHVDNLEWMTRSENMKHSFNNGTHNIDHLRGSNSPVSKLTKEDVLEIKRLCKESEITQRKIAEIFNIDPSHVSDIKRGRRWAHLN